MNYSLKTIWIFSGVESTWINLKADNIVVIFIIDPKF